MKKTVFDIQKTFDQGLQLYRAGKLAEAQNLYNRILSRNPDHADSIHLLGLIAAQTGSAGEAISLIARAIELNDAVPYYHNNLGKIFKDTGRLDEAQKHLQRAVALMPVYVDAINNLGTVFHARHEYAKAEEHFARALKLDPDYADSHNNLGGVYLQQGLLDKAQSSFERAHALKPACSETYFNLKCAHFIKEPIEKWGDICREMLRFQHLSDFHKFDALVRLAIHYWATDNLTGTLEALRLSQPFPWATINTADKKFKNTQAFRDLLIEVLKFYAANDFRPRPAEKRMAIIGDSHCLSYTNTSFDIEGVSHKITPHLIMGCKAWHLAQEPFNHFKWSLNAIVDRLPHGMPCMMSIGEIDCRYNEGIIPHHKKNGASIDETIVTTAQNYARYVATVMKNKNRILSFINVPAPHIEKLRSNDSGLAHDDEKLLIKVIRDFNAALKKEAEVLNIPVLDRYGITTNSDGVAVGNRHLDGYHLKPDTLIRLTARA